MNNRRLTAQRETGVTGNGHRYAGEVPAVLASPSRPVTCPVTLPVAPRPPRVASILVLSVPGCRPRPRPLERRGLRPRGPVLLARRLARRPRPVPCLARRRRPHPRVAPLSILQTCQPHRLRVMSIRGKGKPRRAEFRVNRLIAGDIPAFHGAPFAPPWVPKSTMHNFVTD